MQWTGLKGELKYFLSFFNSSRYANDALGTTPVDGQAMPQDEQGTNAKYVAVCHDGGGTSGHIGRIAFGNSTIAVTSTTGFCVPANKIVVFDTLGFSHFAAVASGSGVDFSVAALENQ